MDVANIKRLSQLSTYLSTSETELGYVVDFTKPYIEIRSTYLSKSLHGLSQTAASDRLHVGIYERGTAEFLRYMSWLTKMFLVGIVYILVCITYSNFCFFRKVRI
jgi:hypothetical protein